MVSQGLDILDPWVCDGREAADLPDLGAIEADEFLAAVQRVIDPGPPPGALTPGSLRGQKQRRPPRRAAFTH
jgi:hypothetical protein